MSEVKPKKSTKAQKNNHIEQKESSQQRVHFEENPTDQTFSNPSGQEIPSKHPVVESSMENSDANEEVENSDEIDNETNDKQWRFDYFKAIHDYCDGGSILKLKVGIASSEGSSKDSFSMFKSPKKLLLVVNWGTDIEVKDWSVDTYESSSKESNATSAIDLTAIEHDSPKRMYTKFHKRFLFRDITQVYVDPEPAMCLRLYLHREVLHFTAKHRDISNNWSDAIYMAQQLQNDPEGTKHYLELFNAQYNIHDTSLRRIRTTSEDSAGHSSSGEHKSGDNEVETLHTHDDLRREGEDDNYSVIDEVEGSVVDSVYSTSSPKKKKGLFKKVAKMFIATNKNKQQEGHNTSNISISETTPPISPEKHNENRSPLSRSMSQKNMLGISSIASGARKAFRRMSSLNSVPEHSSVNYHNNSGGMFNKYSASSDSSGTEVTRDRSRTRSGSNPLQTPPDLSLLSQSLMSNSTANISALLKSSTSEDEEEKEEVEDNGRVPSPITTQALNTTLPPVRSPSPSANSAVSSLFRSADKPFLESHLKKRLSVHATNIEQKLESVSEATSPTKIKPTKVKSSRRQQSMSPLREEKKAYNYDPAVPLLSTRTVLDLILQQQLQAPPRVIDHSSVITSPTPSPLKRPINPSLTSPTRSGVPLFSTQSIPQTMHVTTYKRDDYFNTDDFFPYGKQAAWQYYNSNSAIYSGEDGSEYFHRAVSGKYNNYSDLFDKKISKHQGNGFATTTRMQFLSVNQPAAKVVTSAGETSEAITSSESAEDAADCSSVQATTGSAAVIDTYKTLNKDKSTKLSDHMSVLPNVINSRSATLLSGVDSVKSSSTSAHLNPSTNNRPKYINTAPTLSLAERLAQNKNLTSAHKKWLTPGTDKADKTQSKQTPIMTSPSLVTEAAAVREKRLRDLLTNTGDSDTNITPPFALSPITSADRAPLQRYNSVVSPSSTSSGRYRPRQSGSVREPVVSYSSDENNSGTSNDEDGGNGGGGHNSGEGEDDAAHIHKRVGRTRSSSGGQERTLHKGHALETPIRSPHVTDTNDNPNKQLLSIDVNSSNSSSSESEDGNNALKVAEEEKTLSSKSKAADVKMNHDKLSTLSVNAENGPNKQVTVCDMSSKDDVDKSILVAQFQNKHSILCRVLTQQEATERGYLVHLIEDGYALDKYYLSLTQVLTDDILVVPLKDVLTVDIDANGTGLFRLSFTRYFDHLYYYPQIQDGVVVRGSGFSSAVGTNNSNSSLTEQKLTSQGIVTSPKRQHSNKNRNNVFTEALSGHKDDDQTTPVYIVLKATKPSTPNVWLEMLFSCKNETISS